MDYKQSLAILDQVCERIHSNEPAQMSKDDSIVLSNLFPHVLAPALAILDQGRVTKFVCQESKRVFFRVREPFSSHQKAPGAPDSTSVQYVDVVGNFCFSNEQAKDCMSEKGSSPLTKHVLAVKLATAMESVGLLEVKMIEDADFAPLLLSSKAHLQKYDLKPSRI